MHTANLEGRFGYGLVYLALSGAVEKVLVRIALCYLRTEVFLRNTEGVKQNSSVGSDSLHGLFFGRGEEGPLWRRDKSPFNDGFGHSLYLSNSKQSANLSHKSLDFLIRFLLDGLYKLIDSEVNSVQLGQLLQSDSNDIVDDVLFYLTWLFVRYPGSNQTDDVAKSLDKHIMQLVESPRVSSCELRIGKVIEPSNIADTVCERFSFGQMTQVAFESIPGYLQVHYGVLSLVSIIRYIFVEQLGQTRVVGSPMAPH